MKKSLAKATAFCFDFVMCFDESLVIRSNKKRYLQGISFFFCELLFEKIYFVIAKKYIIDIISITDTICEYN